MLGCQISEYKLIKKTRHILMLYFMLVETIGFSKPFQNVILIRDGN